MQKILLILSFIALASCITCFSMGIHLLHKLVKRQHVFFDLKRPVAPGDTLYVIAVKKDSVWLYGK